MESLSTRSTLIAVMLAAITLAGCADRPVVIPDVADSPSAVVERVQCAADVRLGQLKCVGSASGGASRSITLGGQGTYIELTAGNSSYASGIFQADVQIRNLTNQAMGTPDGSAVAGLKAFIATGPSVTSGTGVVTVDNADGTAAFTAANQPYFEYDEILHVFSGTTAPKTWRFAVPATVNTFTFTVLVQTTLPVEVGILRWTTDRGRPVVATAVYAADSENVFACSAVCYRSTAGGGWVAMTGPLPDSLGRSAGVLGMGGTSATNVWAVGNGGFVARYDGISWHVLPAPTSIQLNSVAVVSPTDVYVTGLVNTKVYHWNGSAWSVAFDVGTGSQSGVIVRALSSTSIWASTATGGLRHYNGSTLDTVAMPAGTVLRGLWVVADNDVWAGATTGALFHYDGTSVTQVTSPTTQAIWGFAGFSPNDVYAAAGSDVLHYDGASWTVVGVLPTTQVTSSLTAVSPTNMYLAGYNGPEQLYHFDGTDVSTPGAAMANLNDMWGNSATNVYAVGVGGTVLHFNGTTWLAEATGSAGTSNGVWGTSSEIWAVGNHGSSVLRRNGGTWSLFTKPTNRILRDVWGSAANAVWAVGDTGTVEKFSGIAWATQNSGVTTQLLGVGGTSATDVWAVGATGVILHYDGTSWSAPVTSAALASTMTLTDVYAAASNDVWVVGTNGGPRVLLHWDGTSWTQQFGMTGPGGISCISGLTASDIWVGGGSGVLFHYNGSSWTPVATGVSAAVCPYAASQTLVFAAGSAGTVLRGTR